MEKHLKVSEIKSKNFIAYEKLKSVKFLEKGNLENEGKDVFGNSIDIILFTDIEDYPYIMRIENFSPKQIQFIIDETKKRANLLEKA